MKNVILAVIILILVGGIAYWQMNKPVEEEVVVNAWQEYSYTYQPGITVSNKVTVAFKAPKSWRATKLSQAGFQIYPPVEIKEGEIVKKIELLFQDTDMSFDNYVQQEDYIRTETSENHNWAVRSSKHGEGFKIYTTVIDNISFSVTAFNLLGYMDVYEDIISTIKLTVDMGTNNWLIYRNEDYGYSIKYPTNVNLVMDRMIERGTQGNPGFELDQGGHFAIGVYNDEDKNTAEQWLDYRYKEYSGGWPGVYQEDLINNINTVKATLDNRQLGDPNNCYIEWFIFTKENSFYTIAGEFCNVDQSSIDLFHDIVSTFEFID